MKTNVLLIAIAIILATSAGCSHTHTTGTKWQHVGTASWYGKDFHGRPTASGEIYNMYGCSAAHKTLPLGSRVRVTNLSNSRSIVVLINDRGPYVGDRIIDMSYGAAKHLGMVKEGLAKVRIEVLKTPGTYTYGFALQFGSFMQRHNAVIMAKKLETIGYTPSIEEASVNGKTFYRVRLGTFQSKKKAQTLARVFDRKGITCAVIGL